MPVLDRQNMFGIDQPVTISAYSTDLIDLGSLRDVGAGEQVQTLIQTTEAFTAAGAATLTVTLETATDAAFTVPVALASTGAIPVASLTLGSKASITTVPGGCLRYLRLSFVVATGPMTAGKVTSALGVESIFQDNVSFPDAVA
jgi:hypothetical protein